MNILNAKLFKFDSYKEKQNSKNASSDSTECSSEVKMKRKRLNVFKKIPVHLFSSKLITCLKLYIKISCINLLFYEVIKAKSFAVLTPRAIDTLPTELLFFPCFLCCFVIRSSDFKCK